MTTPTLSQLADIGAAAAQRIYSCRSYVSVDPELGSYATDADGREAFAKAVLDAVGYKFPVDPEREAFDAWCKVSDVYCETSEFAFKAWKAGRDSLREKWGIVVQDKPQPETFEAHGLTWIKHTPGDPMPCDGDAFIDVLWRNELPPSKMTTVAHDGSTASEWKWGMTRNGQEDVVGWRYIPPPADAP